jgi:hypothetical protein
MPFEKFWICKFSDNRVIRENIKIFCLSQILIFKTKSSIIFLDIFLLFINEFQCSKFFYSKKEIKKSFWNFQNYLIWSQKIYKNVLKCYIFFVFYFKISNLGEAKIFDFKENLITAFDQNWPVWSSFNINGQWYVAMSESGKSLNIDCWNINLYFKLFFRSLASQKVWWPIYINRTSVVAHFK